MDIIKGYKTTVKFAVPSDLMAAQAAIFQDDAQVGGPIAAVVADGVAGVDIPYNVISSPGDFQVILTFSYEATQHTLEKDFTVVTPYIELYELRSLFPDKSDDELWELEEMARYVINTHCGQTFDYKHKAISETGKGDQGLRLSERIVSLETITEAGVSVYDTSYPTSDGFLGSDIFYVSDSRWMVTRPVFPYQDIKADINIEVNEPNTIYDPFYFKCGFATGTVYVFTGYFGWTDVPENVKRAARLLVKDYACQDVLYRDRFLTSIRTQDWTIEISDLTWRYTGNVRADHLLEPYVRLDWIAA